MSAGRPRPWARTAAAAVLGAGLGLGVATALPVTHTAVSRVAVTPVEGEMDPLSPDTRRAEQAATMYAAWVGNHAADGSWTPPSTTSVSAEAQPDSRVVDITVAAPDPQAARTGADAVASRLVRAVEDSVGRDNPENALVQFRKRAPELARAEVAVRAATIAHAQAEAGDGSVAETGPALDEARAEERRLRAAQAGDENLYRRLASATDPRLHLEQVAPATAVGDPASLRLVRGGALGAVAGAGLGFGVGALGRRRRADHTGTSEVA